MLLITWLKHRYYDNNISAYIYYVHYKVTIMVIKINNVSIDVYISHSEMTYEDTYWRKAIYMQQMWQGFLENLIII